MDDEYITREDAKWAACKAWCHPGAFCPDNYCIEVRKVFDAIPAADVAPVVRCRDCRWRHDDSNPMWLPCMEIETDQNWYCADGERLEVQDG